MFDFPLKKDFHKEFYDKTWKTLFILKYKQATLEEFLEFSKKNIVEQTIELYDIIHSQLPFTFLQKVYKIFFLWYKTKIERSIKYEEIALEIQNNKFKMHKSIFEEYDKKNKGGKNKGWKNIFANSIKTICKEYNLNIDEVLNLTLEQFFYLYDWVRFYENSKTKEWISINNFATRDVDEAKKTAEKIRKAFNE